MAAEVIQCAGRQQAPSGSGTQNFTISGFGTPDAAIVISQVGGVDADSDHLSRAIGFWDGTNDANANHSIRHGQTPGSTIHHSGTHNTSVVYHNIPSVGVRSATITNITDGVQLSWNAESAFQPYATVILIKNATAAAVGTFQPDQTATNTVNVTTTGVNPNFIFFANSYNTTINNTAAQLGCLSMGWASNESGGITNHAVGNGMQNNNPTVCGAYISDTDCILEPQFTLVLRASVTDMDTADQFTVTTNVGSSQNAHVAYLALQFDDAPEAFIATTPTSGDFDPHTAAAQPTAAIFGTSMSTAKNAIQTGGNGDAAGGFGWYFADDSGSADDEYGGYASTRNGQSTTDTQGRVTTSMIMQLDSGGAPEFQASSPTFDSTGLVFTPTTYDGQANYVIGAYFGASGTNTSIESATGRGIMRGVGRGAY